MIYIWIGWIGHGEHMTLIHFLLFIFLLYLIRARSGRDIGSGRERIGSKVVADFWGKRES